MLKVWLLLEHTKHRSLFSQDIVLPWGHSLGYEKLGAEAVGTALTLQSEDVAVGRPGTLMAPQWSYVTQDTGFILSLSCHVASMKS